MQVVSGAGEFELSVQSVEVRDSSVVLVGKMGIWEAETIIHQSELGHLLRVMLSPQVLLWALGRPYHALRQRLQGRRADGG